AQFKKELEEKKKELQEIDSQDEELIDSYEDKIDALEEKVNSVNYTDEQKEVFKSELAALLSRISVYKLILNAIYGQCIINSDLHSEVSMEKIQPRGANLPIKKVVSSL